MRKDTLRRKPCQYNGSPFEQRNTPFEDIKYFLDGKEKRYFVAYPDEVERLAVGRVVLAW
jgi:hypothetical protein